MRPVDMSLCANPASIVIQMTPTPDKSVRFTCGSVLAVSSHPDLVECDSDALHFTFDRPSQTDRQCLRPKKSALYRQPTPSSRIPCTAHNSGDFFEHALFLGLHIDRGGRERGVSTTTIEVVYRLDGDDLQILRMLHMRQ
jgi:hypothetical protein